MRVNTFTDYDQYPNNRSLTALEDGGYVVIWTSQNQDGSGVGVYGQIFNGDGSRRGSEFRVSTVIQGNQADARVTGLVDGSFVVVDLGPDRCGERLGCACVAVCRERRRSEQPVLGEPAAQRAGSARPTVGATADGFVVTWTDANDNADTYFAGADRHGNGIFKQQFTIDDLNASAGHANDAHRPLLTAAAASGLQHTTAQAGTIALNVAASLAPGSLVTETLSIEINAIPVGATISDGTHSFTSTNALNAVDVSSWNLAQLTVTPAMNSLTAFTLESVRPRPTRRATTPRPTSRRFPSRLRRSRCPSR